MSTVRTKRKVLKIKLFFHSEVFRAISSLLVNIKLHHLAELREENE